jgi:tripartite-type tricarboxylate transporter receptor subunit TctC
VAEAPIAIAVKNDGRFDSLEALFKAATASSEGISFSTPNPYHTQRLALAGFARQHDITFKYVQLPGGNEIAIKNLVAGKVDFAFLAAHNLVKAREAGDLKILGVAHPQRLEFLPDDPTFMEQGYELATAIWLGLFARAGSPADILDKLRTAAESAASSGPVANQIRSMHMVPTFIDSKSFEKKVAADTAFHLSVLKHLGAL